MAKTKSIESRPLIIVTLTTTKWKVERRKDNKKLVIVDDQTSSEDTNITQHRIIKTKPETTTTGKFKVITGNWDEKVVLPDGSVKHAYECHRKGIKQTYSSLQKAFRALEKALQQKTVKTERDVVIKRSKETYYNPKTKQITSDHTEAAGWFKGHNPLFISSSPYQKIGVWLNPGKDYVEVNYYYNNRIQRQDCEQWTKAKIAGFRLYNDGTVSHFYKGKVHDKERVFETNRVNYRTLDPRFREQYRLSTLALDLRSPELIGSDHYNNKLCKESLEILRKAGFPKEYWCWGNNRRAFTDTYDLINFATHVQHTNQTNRGASIDKFLADKPFGPECDNVLKFNKGVIIRIPGYREVWSDGNGKSYCYRPSYWETDVSKIKLLEAEVYERYRVWISDNGRTRSCQELIHDGDCWNRTRWDKICWPETNLVRLDDRETPNTFEEKRKQQKAINQFKSMAEASYTKIFKLLPVFTRFESFVSEYPDLEGAIEMRNFFDSLYQAPKLTETLIKLGYGHLFYQKSEYCYQVYSRNNDITHFSLGNVLARFGIRNYEYKEIAGNTMYKNLGVSKEQFNWLVQYNQAEEFMRYFKDVHYVIPNTNSEHYGSFAAVPVKYLKIVAEIIEKIKKDHPMCNVENWIENLLNSYGYSPLDIEKAVKRGLNLQVLIDYLRLRNECRVAPNFNIRDWDKMPEDATDLRFSHDRICAFYNLIQSERERYWREQEEQRMIEHQAKYEERYKKLKSLSYVEDGNTRTVIVPKKLIELVVEGQVLHHCVGSFATSVAEGRDTIVFLRNKEKPDEPYATISLLKDGDTWRIDQAHTAHNGPITEEDVEFLKRWAAKNNVDPSTVCINYGLHCHH